MTMDILPSQQHRIIEEDKFAYSPLGKTFEKQSKTIEEQRKKQLGALQHPNLYNQQIQSYQSQTKPI